MLPLIGGPIPVALGGSRACSDRLSAAIREVSTRKVEDLVKALGADAGISKSEVSRICGDLDQEVGAFRDRDLSAMGYLHSR